MQKEKPINTVKKLKLLDYKITIKYVEKDEDDNDEYLYGHTHWDTNDVVICISLKTREGKPFTEDELNATLRHELFHVILHSLYFETESNNETLVEWLAQATKMLNKQGVNI